MPKQATIDKKQALVNEVKEKLDRAVSIVLVDARGIKVDEDTVLRKKFREAGADYKVYKNSILERAVEGTPFEGLKEHLKGPSAIAISYEDATATAAIIDKEKKTVEALEFKAGFIDGVLYDAEGIAAIASIPPKEELLSKLLGSFQSPMGNFARVIDQIAKNKTE
ncbi:MAG: 50S ribosomal protein L10 [Defluviitaleaceae bacterium]|nr:50S ribosomal protein L10 [Defluviitaleaceae bacterium]